MSVVSRSRYGSSSCAHRGCESDLIQRAIDDSVGQVGPRGGFRPAGRRRFVGREGRRGAAEVPVAVRVEQHLPGIGKWGQKKGLSATRRVPSRLPQDRCRRSPKSATELRNPTGDQRGRPQLLVLTTMDSRRRWFDCGTTPTSSASRCHRARWSVSGASSKRSRGRCSAECCSGSGCRGGSTGASTTEPCLAPRDCPPIPAVDRRRRRSTSCANGSQHVDRGARRTVARPGLTPRTAVIAPWPAASPAPAGPAPALQPSSAASAACPRGDSR